MLLIATHQMRLNSLWLCFSAQLPSLDEVDCHFHVTRELSTRGAPAMAEAPLCHTANLPYDTRPQYALHLPEQHMSGAHLIGQNCRTLSAPACKPASVSIRMLVLLLTGSCSLRITPR